ncbi:MAG TPA: hypothetical protein VM582_01685, partial [Candidatus Thermoplasmatota archaeon]|nr:hypothetical protein [Candidatus Thermoplasmatota archaeon]
AGAALGRRTWAHALAIAAACLAGGVLGLLADDGRPALLLFAAGAGAATLALLRLGDAARGRAGAAGVFLGLLATYAAGVLHEL